MTRLYLPGLKVSSCVLEQFFVCVLFWSNTWLRTKQQHLSFCIEYQWKHLTLFAKCVILSTLISMESIVGRQAFAKIMFTCSVYSISLCLLHFDCFVRSVYQADGNSSWNFQVTRFRKAGVIWSGCGNQPRNVSLSLFYHLSLGPWLK